MRALTICIIALFSLLNFNTEEVTLVEGVIKDDAGQELIGVSVHVIGTNIGTSTDYNGKYSIEVPKKFTELEFRYTGYTKKKVLVDHTKNKLELNVEMSTDGMILEEVVVVGNGVHRARKSMAYSTSTVKRKTRKNRRNGKNSQLYSMPQAPPKTYSGLNKPSKQEIENQEVKTAKENTSTFSIDVDRASYSSIRGYLNRGQMPPKDEVRIEEMINYFHYEYPTPKTEDPIAVQTQLTDCPWNFESKLLHIGLQGRKIANKDLPATNLVFLIDVSGSMNSANKLPLLKESFNLLLNNLRPKERGAIFTYAGYSRLVLPSTSAKEKEKIIAAVNSLGTGGGTAGAQGIKDAYKIANKNFIQDGNNRVILATDGDFNIGVSSDEALVKLIEKERESGVFLSVLGFGMGNYRDGKMQKLANKGNGNHAYIDDIQEAKKVFINEFGGTLFTIAKDVKLQIEFDESVVKSYRLVGYENRVLANKDFDDDTKDAGELGAGHVVTAMYEIVLHEQTRTESPLAELKFRYKKPDGHKSKKLVQSISAKQQSLEKCKADVQFAIAVAEFGMILRDSKYSKAANLDHVIHLAKKANKKQSSDYRKEFVKLVEKTKGMKSSTASVK